MNPLFFTQATTKDLMAVKKVKVTKSTYKYVKVTPKQKAVPKTKTKKK